MGTALTRRASSKPAAQLPHQSAQPASGQTSLLPVAPPPILLQLPELQMAENQDGVQPGVPDGAAQSQAAPAFTPASSLYEEADDLDRPNPFAHPSVQHWLALGWQLAIGVALFGVFLLVFWLMSGGQNESDPAGPHVQGTPQPATEVPGESPQIEQPPLTAPPPGPAAPAPRPQLAGSGQLQPPQIPQMPMPTAPPEQSRLAQRVDQDGSRTAQALRTAGQQQHQLQTPPPSAGATPPPPAGYPHTDPSTWLYPGPGSTPAAAGPQPTMPAGSAAQAEQKPTMATLQGIIQPPPYRDRSRR